MNPEPYSVPCCYPEATLNVARELSPRGPRTTSVRARETRTTMPVSLRERARILVAFGRLAALRLRFDRVCP